MQSSWKIPWQYGFFICPIETERLAAFASVLALLQTLRMNNKSHRTGLHYVFRIELLLLCFHFTRWTEIWWLQFKISPKQKDAYLSHGDPDEILRAFYSGSSTTQKRTHVARANSMVHDFHSIFWVGKLHTIEWDSELLLQCFYMGRSGKSAVATCRKAFISCNLTQQSASSVEDRGHNALKPFHPLLRVPC